MSFSTCQPCGTALFESLEERLLLAVSAEEQLFVYLLNKARHDPAAYAAEAGLAVTLDGVAPQQPLAVSAPLFDAAEFHADEMATNDYFAHQSAVTADWPNKMARDAGYTLPAAWLDAANNIESIDATLAGAADTLGQLLENAGADPLDTQAHLLAGDLLFEPHREIGVGHATDAASALVDYWAVHTAYTDGTEPFLTGVVFDDLNFNGTYDLNEGLAGVDVTDGTATVQTNAQGGWSLPYDGSLVVVICSGAGFGGPATAWLNATQLNTEIDFVSGHPTGVVNFGDITLVAPNTPTGVSATDGTHTDKVAVTWNAAAGATAYEVWRHTADDSAGAAHIVTVAGTTYDDTTAAAGTGYHYWVKARNAIGASGFSASNAGRRNDTPTVGTLTPSADPIDRGDALTLTADNVADSDGTVAWVRFYHDTDDSGDFDEDFDTALGWGSVTNGTATYAVSTTSLGYGLNRFFARAYDNDLDMGAAATATVTVTNPDPVVPTALLAANDLTTPAGATHEFTVTYTDNVAINFRTVGSGDVRVTGPNGYDQLATYAAIDTRSDGSPRVVTYRIYGTGRTWDFTDNGTYTVTMEADQVTDTNANPVAAAALGTFDVTISDKPDLVVDFATISLPATCVPGDSAWVSVTITNQGGVTAEGTVVNNLHLSADQALGGDTLLATQNTPLRLAPGFSQTLRFRANLPGDALPADLYILADVDATDAITEESEANNLAATAGTYAVVWQFGAVGTRTRVNLTVEDADGTDVTFSLRGNGNGTVSVGPDGLDVVLTGTDNRSWANANPARGGGGNAEADLGDLTVGDPLEPLDETSLAGFYGRQANLAGDVTVTGGLTTLYLDDVTGDGTLTVSAWPDARASLSIHLDRVQDFSIDSAMPIRYLSATDWLDTGGADDTVTAPTLWYYSVRGNRRDGIQGDSQVNLTLTDAAATQTLGTVYIAGWLDGADIRSAGNTGILTFGGLRNAFAFAGIDAGVDHLPDALGDFDFLATIRSVYVKGVTGEANSWINSSVGAATVSSVRANDILYANGGTPHGVATQNLGRLYYYDDTLRYAWPNRDPAEVNGPLPRQDFTVNLGLASQPPGIDDAPFG
jgi:hypothetical protein